jgi:aminoglycoside phosphotransferase (APT) family kinase protein
MTDNVPPALAEWLSAQLGDRGPFHLIRLSGGNSNETFRLDGAHGRWILRRPPRAGIAPSAHSMQREYQVLTALAGEAVPTPRPLAYCADKRISPVPLLVMEYVQGIALSDEWPTCWPTDLYGVGATAVDALVALQAVDWQAAGLDGFGRPDGFLARQVPRWRHQYELYRCRELHWLDPVARWLEANRPPEVRPALLHGDFHLDNCLLAPQPRIRVAAIIDWEMATIGDPLLDLGLLLAFWGDDRPEQPAMSRVQAITRQPSAPSRQELARRYAAASGRSVEHLAWYMALAFFKLAAVVEGAYAQYLNGLLSSDYARDLAHDVPRLLDEAAQLAGLQPRARSGRQL